MTGHSYKNNSWSSACNIKRVSTLTFRGVQVVCARLITEIIRAYVAGYCEFSVDIPLARVNVTVGRR